MEERHQQCTICTLRGTFEQRDRVKEAAKLAQTSINRFILDAVLAMAAELEKERQLPAR